MARIRTIKPEFFTSEDIVSVSPLARLFYVSLWCEADREGRLEWKPGTFKMRYLPGDSCDVAVLAEELTARSLIQLYEVDGKRYALIPKFKKHQVINNRESERKEGKERKRRRVTRRGNFGRLGLPQSESMTGPSVSRSWTPSSRQSQMQSTPSWQTSQSRNSLTSGAAGSSRRLWCT
jgi:hypothetical protein